MERAPALLRRMIPARLRLPLKRTAMRLWYFGLRHECPECGARLRSLLPLGEDFPVLREKQVIGGGYRLNAQCPVCGSTDRERLVYLWLKNESDIFKGPKRILHVAPERELGAILRRRTNLDYLSADLFDPDAMIRLDVTRMDFPDGHFDAVLCNHVLEHVPDDRQAMREIYRILKSGGWAVLQTPLSPLLDRTYEDASISSESEREQAFGQADHVRIYGRDYPARLKAAGFEVEVFDWKRRNGRFGGDRNRFALNGDEPVIVARKA